MTTGRRVRQEKPFWGAWLAQPAWLALLLSLSLSHAAQPPAGNPQSNSAPPAGNPQSGTAQSGTPQYRPEYHFTPARNWMNDPNGLIYFGGRYHLFFQHNPYGDQWGHMSWGHAVSRDLVHWQELPVAIPETRAWMIFSGSIVADTMDSSGLGSRRAAPLVAIYTAHGQDSRHLESQAIASSVDGGATWTQYPGNPVLDLRSQAFRDPKVFWHEQTRQWVMVAALSELHQVTFYGSPNLKDWQHLGDFGPAGATDGAWECPDLFVLPVEDSPGESRWVLKVDVNGSRRLQGSGAQYLVGRFDGHTFLPDDSQGPQEADFGRDFYASSSWSNAPKEPRRRVWIAWMSDPRYAGRTPTAPWRGAMSVPRELSLRRSGNVLLVAQTPVRELRALRANARPLPRAALRADDTTDLGPLQPASEVEAWLELGTAGEAGLAIRLGPSGQTEHPEQILIGYDAHTRELFADRTQAGLDVDPAFATRQHTPLPLNAGSALHLDILLDRSSIEVFAEHGLKVLTLLAFPSRPGARLYAYASGGEAVLAQGTSWDLAGGHSHPAAGSRSGRAEIATVGVRR